MSKLECKSLVIYMVEGSIKIKAHHAHFTTTVQCLLDKIGNGQKGITSTRDRSGAKKVLIIFWKSSVGHILPPNSSNGAPTRRKLLIIFS